MRRIAEEIGGRSSRADLDVLAQIGTVPVMGGKGRGGALQNLTIPELASSKPFKSPLGEKKKIVCPLSEMYSLALAKKKRSSKGTL